VRRVTPVPRRLVTRSRSRPGRERNRHALREFWARAPADALGVKREFEKALAQDGKPAK
jgi:hypothetical protein